MSSVLNCGVSVGQLKVFLYTHSPFFLPRASYPGFKLRYVERQLLFAIPKIPEISVTM